MKNKSILSLMPLKATLIILTSFLASHNISAQGWYSTDWSYRMPVTITNSGSELTDYQVQVSLNASFNWSNIDNNGDGIRFTRADGVYEIEDFWIESWDYGTSAIIWVKVPSIAASPSTTTIYLYYGNSNATNASDGDATFDFFDGFDGSSLDTNKWTTTTSGGTTSISVANDSLSMTATAGFSAGNWIRIDGNTPFGTGYVGETRGRHPDQGTKDLVVECGFIASGWTESIRILDDFPNTDKWQRLTQSGGSIDTPPDTMAQDADQNLHIFRTYRNTDNTVTFQIDDNNGEDDITIIPTGSLYPFLMSFSKVSGTTNTFIVDWTRVRKWDEEAELSTTLGTEQELNIWTGTSSTDWATGGNWSISQVPGSASYTLIPVVTTNYPIISGNDPVKISNDINIESSASLTIEPGGALTVGGKLANNGTLNLDSDNSGIASLILDSYSGTGTENIELYVTGLGTAPNYNWHYISSPVSNLPVSTFTGITLNLAAFYESRPTTYTSEGWVAYDGYIYSTGLMGGPEFSTLTLGQGYDLYHDYSDRTFTLSGNINTGDVNIPLSYTSTNEGEWNGLNLIGNPYTSSIDWSVIDDNLETGVGGAIYFTKGGSLVQWVDGVSTPSGEATGVIPPMQGFMVFTTTTGTSIDIVASRDRVHGTQTRYKSESIIPLLRMKLSNESLSDETVIRFKNEATTDFDYSYDAFKLMVNESMNQLWTEINNEKYSINSIPFPEDETVIPLMVNIPEAGQYTLKSTELTGLDNYNVILTDHTQGNYQVNLKQTPEYTFSADKGINNSRFTITLGDFTTGFEEIENDKNFNIYTFADQLFVQNMSDNWSNSLLDVNVYDLTGRLISKHLKNEIYSGETIQLPFNRPDGIYLIEITDGKRRTVQKLSHR